MAENESKTFLSEAETAPQSALQTTKAQFDKAIKRLPLVESELTPEALKNIADNLRYLADVIDGTNKDGMPLEEAATPAYLIKTVTDHLIDIGVQVPNAEQE